MPSLTNLLRFSEPGRSSTSHPLKNLHALLTCTYRTSYTHFLSLNSSYPSHHFVIHISIITSRPMLSIMSPLIFIPICFTILDSHASGSPCTRAVPFFISFFAASTPGLPPLLLTSRHHRSSHVGTCTSHRDGDTFRMPPDRRHDFSLHLAAGGGSSL